MGVLLSVNDPKNPGFWMEVAWRLVIHLVMPGVVFGWCECNNSPHMSTHNCLLGSLFIGQPYMLPFCASSVHEVC